ncbi:MAG: UvrD-helicase domain-containing protein [Ruminococcus sp.]|nr:UvrD-helicase domain-containing protein [Ruminococcus sp.]
MEIKVLGNILDKEQTKAAIYDKNSIIIAGAGSGKSLTMVGKIKYLVENKNINIKDILCITFTNNAALSLQNKIKKELNLDNKVYTFHKLALEILNENNIKYKIIEDNYLEYLVNEVLDSLYPNPYFIKLFNEKNYFKSNKYLNYKKTIIRFINLFISNYYDISYLDKIINKASLKDIPYLKIIRVIYQVYLNEKISEGSIDFDDMIYKATNIIRKNGITKKYKYIIIDEYQDTSKVRENLIKEIILKTKAYITVVGDDFQSIYRFSGCDLNNFLDFSKNFKPVKKLYLTNTYRNSKELIKIAGSFVMKNPRQIKKILKSNKSILKPIIIFYYKDIKKDFKKAIDIINSDNLMILGRNNLDIYKVIDNNSISNNIINYANKNIYYKTIHKAKGLEEDNILIINLTNDNNSLPSKIKDENILKYVLIHKDIYPFEEERRLFYVALTRTKNYCYLFIDKKNSSIFLKELIRDYKKYITFINL